MDLHFYLQITLLAVVESGQWLVLTALYSFQSFQAYWWLYQITSIQDVHLILNNKNGRMKLRPDPNRFRGKYA
jgi:hypothetical protein